MPLQPTLKGPTRALVGSARALVEAFADEPFDPDMARCPHCVSADDLEALAQPVTSLDPTLVARFVLKAGTTWGGPRDLRRVAPRALLLAADRLLPVDRAVLWEKLAWAGWPAWPEPQRDAVERFALVEWQRLLHTPPRPGATAHDWLAGAAGAGWDVRPFLAGWDDAIGPMTEPPGRRAAVLHLVGLLVHSDLRPDHPHTAADLVDGQAPNAEALTAWLTSTTTLHALERAAGPFEGSRDARRVALAVERLRRFRAAAERTPVHAS